jgi:hypothetical protein
METVTVVSEDAITALRAAEHSEAADWWEMYMGGKHWMFGNNLMFRASEGRILNPDEVEQEVPGTCERFNRLFSEIETTDDEDNIVF